MIKNILLLLLLISTSLLQISVVATRKNTSLSKKHNTVERTTILAFGAFPNIGSIVNKNKNSNSQKAIKTDKDVFLNSLDTLDKLNSGSASRTELLNTLIRNRIETNTISSSIKNSGLGTKSNDEEIQPSQSLSRPGLVSTFQNVAVGTWKVIYAPHMTTMSSLVGGTFDVSYVLNDDGSMLSHAYYKFPIIGSGYLSVSGTYGSVNEIVSRVNFDKVWIKSLLLNKNKNDPPSLDDDGPYQTLEDVPDSLVKKMINNIGKTFFIDSFSVFPVSFLDADLCVFDFELLGTRICAKKIQ